MFRDPTMFKIEYWHIVILAEVITIRFIYLIFGRYLEVVPSSISIHQDV